MVWHFLPLIGMLFFIVVGLGVRPWLRLRRGRRAGIMLFRTGRRLQNIRDALFVVLLAGMTAEAFIEAAAPRALSGLAPVLSPRTAAAIRPLGAALLVAGLALFLVAQAHLGPSWRIGIDEHARPGLVTCGMYRFCRNPIFLFMETAFVGFTLLLPNWLSAVLLFGALIGIRKQVSEEEAYLLRAYGDDYRLYARRVGRFFPWIGRLRE